MSNSVIEDRGIGGQARDRELIDIASKRQAIEKVPRDVIEPNALSQIVKDFSSSHGYSSYSSQLCVQQVACQKTASCKTREGRRSLGPTDTAL